jgi:hypothetical protein
MRQQEATMGEMAKIVTEHVHASDLPTQCREGLDDATIVRVTVEIETALPEANGVPGYGFAKGLYAGLGEEPTRFVRQLRDEWHQ